MEKTKEIYGIIYLIRNKINGKIYIGQTIQKRVIKDRYKNNLFKYTHNEHLKRSIEKYGIENFDIDEEFDVAYSKEELDKLEDMYIKIYNTIDGNCGYNKKGGGQEGKINKEVREDISNKVKELWNNEDYREKVMRNRNYPTGENHPNYGKSPSDETRKKISEANNGDKHFNWGKHLSQETKDKISKANKEGYNYFRGKTGGDSPKAKAVYCYEFDEIRLSNIEWVRELKIAKASAITRCCNNELNHHKGFHFRYATEEEVKEYDPSTNTNITIEMICEIYSKVCIYILCEEINEINTSSYFKRKLNISNNWLSELIKKKGKGVVGGYHFRRLTQEETKNYLINNFNNIIK